MQPNRAPSCKRHAVFFSPDAKAPGSHDSGGRSGPAGSPRPLPAHHGAGLRCDACQTIRHCENHADGRCNARRASWRERAHPDSGPGAGAQPLPQPPPTHHLLQLFLCCRAGCGPGAPTPLHPRALRRLCDRCPPVYAAVCGRQRPSAATARLRLPLGRCAAGRAGARLALQ